MALFPKCDFSLLLPNGVVVAGARLDGILEVDVPEDIPRADHIDLFLRTRAWAGYGSGKNRSVVSRDLYFAPLGVDLPKNTPLSRGKYRYPFTLDVPAWLPPNLSGSDCAIEHVIEARLDVDWAVDPKTKIVPVVVLPPGASVHTPHTIRSPNGFHDRMVLEVSLASTVRGLDEPLRGSVALRNGHDARFDAVVLSLLSVATITMSRRDRRIGAGLSIRIPAAGLRNGESVPFEFPPEKPDAPLVVPPTFRNGFIDHDVILKVEVDIPWGFDPSFEIPLQVLPRGSQIVGENTTRAVGGERLRILSQQMAAATGVPPGRPPDFIAGPIGPAMLHVSDGPRAGKLGIDVDIQFPDVALGAGFRRLGILEALRASPLLDAALADRYLLRIEPEEEGRPAVDDAVLRGFFHAVLRDIRPADDIQLDDRHVRIHFPILNDGTDEMVAVARFAQTRAKEIVDAIAGLPFPRGLEAARAAWQAVAGEQSAFLAPSGPSLHGLFFRSRVLGGEERALAVTLRTVWPKGAPFTHVDVALLGAALSKDACMELARGSDRLKGVSAVFPEREALGPERITLERPDFVSDPRALFSGLEALLFWVLEVRGERRADQPYR